MFEVWATRVFTHTYVHPQISVLLAALGGAHVETGGDDGDGGESSPWPVSVGSFSSSACGGTSPVCRIRVCAAALVAVVACRDAAEIDNEVEDS
jgi:hypothetical protein